MPIVVGLTVKLVPVWLPGFKVYVFAPLGVITTDAPLQITLLLPNGAIVIVGVAFTVILAMPWFDAALAQPVALLLPSIV